MNISKFKLKKICTEYKVTDSYHFNDKHSACSYLDSIAEILIDFDLTDEIILSCYDLSEFHFTATFTRMNASGVDIECEIDFDTTTLLLKVIE